MRLSTGLAWLCLVATASAELPWTRLDSISPAGAKAGTTATLRPTGAELAHAEQLWFSHPGIKGRRVPGSSPADVQFEVQVATEVPPGLYDVGVIGPFGLSNVRTFVVGDTAERTEVEPNETSANDMELDAIINGTIGRPTDVDAFRFRAAPGRKVIVDCLAARLDSPLLPVLEVVDGRGQRIAFARAGRTDDPLLVFDPPAEGEYTVRVYDQTYRGGEQFVYRLALRTGPHLLAVQPVSVPPATAISSTVVGFNLPGAQSAPTRWQRLPLEERTASLTGPQDPFHYDRILPVPPREAGIDSFSWNAEFEGARSQPVRMLIGRQPAVAEVEPNQILDQAQELTVPSEICGDFSSIADVDVFRCAVTKGNPLWIEVFADRVGSRADATLSVEFIPAAGGERMKVATVDDTATSLLPVGFETHSDDPSFRFDPPADGHCLITLRDQYGQTRGDVTLSYRLVVRFPQPDFRLVAVPTSRGIGHTVPASLRRGDTLELTLVAFRHDGFDGPIEVPAAELGGGLTSSATLIPARQSTAPFVIQARDDASIDPQQIHLTARALVKSSDGPATTLERFLRPAVTIRGTANVQGRDVPAAVRLARQFVLSAASEVAPLELQHGQPQQVAAQSRALIVPLKLTRRTAADVAVAVKPRGLPKGTNIEVPEVTFAAGETEKSIRVFVRPDAPAQTTVFNWIATSKIQYRPDPAPPQSPVALAAAETPPAPRELDVTAISPPLVIEVVPAPVTIDLAGLNEAAVAVGQSVTIPVRLKRNNGFQGPVALSLFAPSGRAGIEAAGVTIAADATEAQLTISAAAGTPTGSFENMTVRATAGDTPVDAPFLLKVQP